MTNCEITDLDSLIAAAQDHDESAIERLLLQFQPLLRSRMYRLWTQVRAGMSPLEWADVEAQITLLFLVRLQSFRTEMGVYFPHYIERMLDFDARAWVRREGRIAALPFSQMAQGAADNSEDSDDLDVWPGMQHAHLRDESGELERALSLRTALDALPSMQRYAVWNCCVLGRTEGEVALELSISRSAVRNRLEAGLGKMRAFFESPNDFENPMASKQTRTGRKSGAVSSGGALRAQFWDFAMAKDEKRPDLVGVGAGRPVLLQGVFDFEATSLHEPKLLSSKLRYIVPIGSVIGIRYLRIGAVCDQMVVVSTVVNGMPHRIVPCAAQSTSHVAFAIVDPIVAGSEIEIHIASAASGIAVIDVGCLQMPA